MHPLIHGVQTFTVKSRTLSGTSDADGEAGETFTATGTVKVKIYPTDNTETRTQYGIDPNDMRLGITDSHSIHLKDRLESTAGNYVVMGIREYGLSVQMDLWREQ